jgi:hypothetical protein
MRFIDFTITGGGIHSHRRHDTNGGGIRIGGGR